MLLTWYVRASALVSGLLLACIALSCTFLAFAEALSTGIGLCLLGLTACLLWFMSVGANATLDAAEATRFEKRQEIAEQRMARILVLAGLLGTWLLTMLAVREWNLDDATWLSAIGLTVAELIGLVTAFVVLGGLLADIDDGSEYVWSSDIHTAMQYAYATPAIPLFGWAWSGYLIWRYRSSVEAEDEAASAGA